MRNEEEELDFPSTRWSVVHDAGASDPGRARRALLELAERYRGPTLSFLRQDGYSEVEANALLTRFFGTLGRASLASIEQGREPFRAWLVRALEDFLASDHAFDVSVEGDSDSDYSAPPEPGEDEDAPEILGYELFELLGVGGEGAAYRAYDSRAQRQVAIKVLSSTYLREPEVVERFRRSVALMSTLDHPNIVRVLDKGGPKDPRPYYAMQLVVGGTLAERQRQQKFRDPERAARLVIKIARAVQHAHQHGILHRDVSPGNVLLDSNDEPFVSDFMARRTGVPGAGGRVGKFAYAAPELADGQGGTVEVDIYGLGAILYELLTGTTPIRADSWDEVRRQHAQGLKPPRAIAPEIPRDLDAVCFAALSRDPRQRHASAGAFADSLQRVLVKLPPLWPKVSRKRRVWLWMSRHPLLAAGALLGAVLLLVADWRTLMSVRAEQAELEAATLHGNAALATAQARAVLALFERYANEVTRAGADPEVRDFIQKGEIGLRVPILKKVFERARSFDSVAVFTADGRILARYPEPAPGFLGREYRFRDYYRCVEQLARNAEHVPALRAEPEVCVSPAYRGESSMGTERDVVQNQGVQFTLATPVYAESGAFIGFVALNKHAKNTLDEIEMGDAFQSGQITALFGLRGVDRDSPPEERLLPKKLTVVAHPGLFNTEERALDPALSRKLIGHFGEEAAPGLQLRPQRVRPWEEAEYVDPVTGGRWLAGFAPVGVTGFVVAVATPREKALGASERHIDALQRYAILLNLGFLLLGGVALYASLRNVGPGTRSE